MTLKLRVPLWAIGLLMAATRMLAQGVPSVESLVAEPGCAHCHTDLKTTSPLSASTLRERTPDLSSAGLRYNPAYLFDYLQNPVPVRQHLGRARMPNFRLSEKEALALVEFLEKQTLAQGPDLPAEVQERLAAPPRTVS